MPLTVLALSLLLIAVLLILDTPTAPIRQRLALPELDHPFDIDEYATVEIDESENALRTYETAAATLVPMEPAHRHEFDQTLQDGWTVAPPAIREWLYVNRGTLLSFREGSRQQFALIVDPRTVSEKNFESFDGKSWRQFSYLVQLEGVKLASEGRTGECLELYFDTLRAADHLRFRGTLLQVLLVMAMETGVCHGLFEWAALPSVSVDELTVCISRLKELWRKDFSASEAFKCEYMYGMHTGDEYGADDWKTRFKLARTPTESELQIHDRLDRILFTWLLEHCDEPRFRRPRFLKRKNGRIALGLGESFLKRYDLPSIAVINQIANTRLGWAMLTPSNLPVESAFDAALEAYDRHRFRRGATLVFLSLVAYKKKSGRYPQRLEDATDPFSIELPRDPYSPTEEIVLYRFATGEMLEGAALVGRRKQIQTRPGQPLIYSVGKDGVDDGCQKVWDLSEQGLGDWIFVLPN